MQFKSLNIFFQFLNNVNMNSHHRTSFSVFRAEIFICLCLRVEKFNLFLFPYLFREERAKNWIIFDWVVVVGERLYI